MPLMAARSWTLGRKLLGNVVPLLVALPTAVAGAMLYDPAQPLDVTPLALIGSCPVLIWFALAYLPGYANGRMRSEIARRLDRESPGPKEAVFVGYASLGYRGALDPHEDVGFLIVRPGEVEFYGDGVRLRMPWGPDCAVERSGNVHSLVGLGGWVVLRSPGETWLIEPREGRGLWKNRQVARDLEDRLREARTANGPW